MAYQRENLFPWVFMVPTVKGRVGIVAGLFYECVEEAVNAWLAQQKGPKKIAIGPINRLLIATAAGSPPQRLALAGGPGSREGR